MNEFSLILAKELLAKGLMLQFKPNSVFASLTLPGTKERDVGYVANEISKVLNNELILIKNKIIPVSLDYVKAIQDKLSSFKPISELNKYNIVEVNIPGVISELMSNGTLQGKRMPSELPIASISIPTPSAETIRSFFKHSLNSVNVYVKEIADKYTESDLITVWERYLGNVSKSNNAIDSLGFNPLMILNDLILLYTAVANIKEERPNGVNVSDDTYKNIMAQFYFELLNYIAMAVDNYNYMGSLKRVIIDMKDQYTLVVHKDNYKLLLDEGYSVESLLGILVDNPSIKLEHMFIDSLKVNADKYKENWAKKAKLANVINLNNEIIRYKTVYSITLETLYNEIIPEDLKEFMAHDLASARKLVDEHLLHEKPSEVLDIQYIVNDIIGEIIFPKTNYKRFTGYMMEYKRLDTNLTPTDAASLACVDLIMDYLLQQVDIVNSPVTF